MDKKEAALTINISSLDTLYRRDGSNWTALILRKKTGVRYSATGGGGSCLTLQVEGVMIMVEAGYVVIDDCTQGCSAIGYTDLDTEEYEFTHQLAVLIDTKLSNFWGGGMRFDFDHIGDFKEGWWPVTYEMMADTGQNVRWPAILYTGNCE